MESFFKILLNQSLQFRFDKIKKYENQIKKLNLKSWESLNKDPRSITEFIV